MTEQEQQTKENFIDQYVPRFRYTFLLPIIATLVSSVALLIVGFLETFRVIVNAYRTEADTLEYLKLHFVELIDVFLLATILYVISLGFYQLFMGRPKNLAPWLRISSVHDLEVKLIGVVVTLLGVTGLASVLSWDGQSELWQIGLTISLLIAALAYFMSRAHN